MLETKLISDWYGVDQTTVGVGDVSANIVTSSRMMDLLDLICLPFSLHHWEIINAISGSLSDDDHAVIGY
jgi:hypothetical protein